MEIYAKYKGKTYRLAPLKKGSPCHRCAFETDKCRKERTRKFPCDTFFKAIDDISEGNFSIREVRRA